MTPPRRARASRPRRPHEYYDCRRQCIRPRRRGFNLHGRPNPACGGIYVIVSYTDTSYYVYRRWLCCSDVDSGSLEYKLKHSSVIQDAAVCTEYVCSQTRRTKFNQRVSRPCAKRTSPEAKNVRQACNHARTIWGKMEPDEGSWLWKD